MKQITAEDCITANPGLLHGKFDLVNQIADGVMIGTKTGQLLSIFEAIHDFTPLTSTNLTIVLAISL